MLEGGRNALHRGGIGPCFPSDVRYGPSEGGPCWPRRGWGVRRGRGPFPFFLFLFVFVLHVSGWRCPGWHASAHVSLQHTAQHGFALVRCATRKGHSPASRCRRRRCCCAERNDAAVHCGHPGLLAQEGRAGQSRKRSCRRGFTAEGGAPSLWATTAGTLMMRAATLVAARTLLFGAVGAIEAPCSACLAIAVRALPSHPRRGHARSRVVLSLLAGWCS